MKTLFKLTASAIITLTISSNALADEYFKLTTQFREGSNECLEGNQVGGSLNGAAFMDECQNVSGQLWKMIPAENGYFKLTTLFRESENECLEGNQVGGSLNGAAFMDECQDVSGQLWKMIPTENGYFKLTTLFRENENECLEGDQIDGSLNGAAFMDKCQDVSGQLWKINIKQATISPNLDIHVPSIVFEGDDFRIDLEFKGQNSEGQFIWGLTNIGANP